MPDHDVTVITLQLAAAPDGPADGPASVLGRLHHHHQQIGSITRAAELLVRRGAAVSIHQQTLNAVVPDAATIDQAMQLAQTVKALAPDTPVEVTQWSAGNAVHSVQITDVPPAAAEPRHHPAPAAGPRRPHRHLGTRGPHRRPRPAGPPRRRAAPAHRRPAAGPQDRPAAAAPLSTPRSRPAGPSPPAATTPPPHPTARKAA
ncbi:hypothetical protein GKE82_23445 [Conexibacter sp. W3-3-2]|uniref:hypothetical protein n=1 Tax=Conexibacter sp. W3-3-2 TaxID=2675227 RepID=UPI0012B829B9|nr:hypothetical protein [Conexibacter sp. W3-3-2]MTD47160.1 hypothetical protein [Conexibacter sp. W3-3-2]